MKFALAQMKVISGRPDLNVQRMKEYIEEARQQGAELVVFPEMCVGGYLVGDRWLDDNWCRELMHWNNEILKASDAIAVAYGNVFLDDQIEDRVKGYHPNRDGRVRRYNAIYVVQDGKPAKRVVENSLLPPGVQPKVLLPNYRFFDDQRYFFSMEYWSIDAGIPLDELCKPFVISSDSHFKEMIVGFEICEDLWYRCTE
jgi:NAD+ synthase (glutamine-hydrolysing)